MGGGGGTDGNRGQVGTRHRWLLWLGGAPVALAVAGWAAWFVMFHWWPATLLRLLPSPGLVIAQACHLPDAVQGVEDLGPTALERFTKDAVTGAFVAAIASSPPRRELLVLARNWNSVRGDEHSMRAIAAAIAPYFASGDAELRRWLPASYQDLTGACWPNWLFDHQDAEFGWPAAVDPPGPGTWRPRRLGALALVALALGAERDSRAWGARHALMTLLAAGGEQADDPRDRALAFLALIRSVNQSDETEMVAIKRGFAELKAGGGDPGVWERDTALGVLRLLVLRAADDHNLALDGGWSLMHELDVGLNARWEAENPDPAQRPVHFAWREGGQAVAGGESAALAAALLGFTWPNLPPGADEKALRAELVTLPADPRRWTPFGFHLACLALSVRNDFEPGDPAVVPEVRWLSSAQVQLNGLQTFGDEPWDGSWGTRAHPRGVCENALLGATLNLLFTFAPEHLHAQGPPPP